MKKEIYLAGGCFWGTEQYLQNLAGVIETDVGYANGHTQSPTYEQVCHMDTGHAETVRVAYDDQVIGLDFLLSMYYEVVNPTAKNRQGGDVGTQYRTGIYYTDESDRETILASIARLQQGYQALIAIEVLPLLCYFKAEDYHQKYLDKNPGGYCHIGADKFEKAKTARDTGVKYSPQSKEQLRSSLSEMQFQVTQNSATEPPFQNEFFSHFEKGIYVDVTTGEPLFVSADKFESGCGWPAFTKPIAPALVRKISDKSHGMVRTEIRSKVGNAHLGHVFEDGPTERGGLRYCINSAALRFIPKEKMEEAGYGDLLLLIL